MDDDFVDPSEIAEFKRIGGGLILEKHCADEKWYVAPSSWSASYRSRLIGPFDSVDDARIALKTIHTLRQAPDWVMRTEFWLEKSNETA